MLQVFLSFPNHPLYFIAAQTGEELHLDRGQYLLAGTTCPQQSDKPDGGGAGIVRVYAVVKGTHAQGLWFTTLQNLPSACVQPLSMKAAKGEAICRDFARMKPAPRRQESL